MFSITNQTFLLKKRGFSCTLIRTGNLYIICCGIPLVGNILLFNKRGLILFLLSIICDLCLILD